jgi:fumarylacetoacetate (FAA) hydrolase
MKLASLKSGRDGKLVVVSTDLSKAVAAGDIAMTLQEALDDWRNLGPRLEDLSRALNSGQSTDAFALDATALESPLPRAYQWADGSAYLNHVELVRRARGAEMPPSFLQDPLMYQGGSDAFLGPRDNIVMADEGWGIDFEGEVAVIVDDVAIGVSAEEAAKQIRLVMLCNDVSLRNLIPGELSKGFGFFHGKPSSAFSPVAVTPDELGSHWREGKLHRPLLCHLNGELFGKADAGIDMNFGFPELIAHAARTRPLSAGTIVGSGTVSNAPGEGHGAAIREGGVGYSCIAEVRMIETINNGAPETQFMAFGDNIRIEMLDDAGNSIFGAIEQTVVEAT